MLIFKPTVSSILILVTFVFLMPEAKAQPRDVPAAYPSSATANYVRSWEAFKPETDANNITTSSEPKDFRMTTQYMDGLGRPLQTVVKKGSLITNPSNPASAANATDMVSAVEYDGFGREPFKYLPSPANNTGGNTHINDGMFKLNPFQQQAAFYNNSNADNPLKGQGETYFYSETQFEPSPLDRVSKALPPGNSWAGNNRGTTAKYYFNTATDAVRIWNVTDGALGTLGSYSSPSAYPAGKLYKNITEDENSKQVIEFKDKGGKVILKKVQLTATADDGSGSSHTGWLCTYYIYDDVSNLRCVIQPRGVEMISSNWVLTDATILAEQCFRYEYDQRNQMIIKKVPGQGQIDMIYDNRDRLVMTQDAIQRNSVPIKWSYTEYDLLNRPVKAGIFEWNTDAQNFRNFARQFINYPWDHFASSGITPEVLTITHYDDYAGLPSGLSSYLTTWSSYFSTATTSWPYPQAPAASAATKGMVTWTSTRILGSSNFLHNVNYYDDKGRVIQVQSANITGGVDVVSTQYTWAGLPCITVQKQQNTNGMGQTAVVVTKNSYDELGRLIKTEKKQGHSGLSGGAMSAYATISQTEYDALGQVKKKKLDPSYNSNAGLETLTYDYNIRGWLLGENRDYARDANNDHYFGFDLGYDKTNNNLVGSQSYAAAQYNGNIAGTVWKSKGDGEKRKYDFTYDAVNRITTADFNQYTGSAFNKTANVDFSLSDMSYDANGNILAMNQKGLKLNTSPTIDQLAYTYQSNSNKLSKVIDDANDNASTLGDFKYDPATKGATDYTYDANGNLISDANKKISSITYNYLNLPSVITITGKGTITYTYDAAGNKLKKVTVDNTVSPSKTTTTLYIGGAVYENDTLQFIAHEEGRIRPVRDANNNIASFTYDYFLKDHLGNVRMVLTEEPKIDIYPAATLETSKVATESLYYTVNAGQVVDRSVATGIPNYANNNTIPNPPVNAPFDNANSAKLYVLNKNSQKIGLGITLKVMSGDKLDIYGKSYYFQNNTGGSSANTAVPVLDILNGFLGAASGGLIDAHGVVTATQLNGITETTAPINSLLNNQTGNNDLTPQKPKAFINYILFDEQFKCVGSGFAPVGDNGALKDYAEESALHNIAVTKNGFVYIWCSNESPVDVFFDNLQVVQTKGPILEETHYYPFGLTMAGISAKALGFGGAKNKYLFNSGSELQNNEFSDGSGLELYDAKNRMYDPQIGRFGQIDPLADMSLNVSSYVFASNNPISINDPLGLKDSIPWKALPNIIVSGVKHKWNTFSNWFTGANVGYKGSGWGHGPRRWMANQFGLGNTASNLFELGLQSQLQNSQVNLTGGLLNALKTDPAMVAFQNKLIAILKTDPRFGKVQFVLKGKAEGGIQFGGERWSSTNEKWGTLNSSNPALHGETWGVAGNPLTWSVRHADVGYSATVKTDGTMVISFHLNDQLDLSPQSGRSEAYNNISAASGFLYHDVAGGNSNMKVNADWEVIAK